MVCFYCFVNLKKCILMSLLLEVELVLTYLHIVRQLHL